MKGEFNSVDGLIAELEDKGFTFRTINELHNSNQLSASVVDSILKWLPAIYQEHPGGGEHLVRALISTSSSYDPTILIELYEMSGLNDTLKNTIAYVLAVSDTEDISSWILTELFSNEPASKSSGLLFALPTKCDIKSAKDLVGFLKRLFDKYAYYEIFQKMLRAYAQIEDVDFLEQKAVSSEKRIARETFKTIEFIRGRKRDTKFPKPIR